MAESHCVFIGVEAAIRELEGMNHFVRSFDYSSGMRIVPYTSDLHVDLCNKYGENPPGGFLDDSDSVGVVISDMVSKASLKGKIVYILEEHFGGWRDSEAILWENGEIAFGPSLEYDDQIKVLKMLGVDDADLYKFKKYDHPDLWVSSDKC